MKKRKMKQNRMMSNVKDTMKVGMTSMVGMGAMGAMSNIPGMPAQAGNITNLTGAGLTLANVGQLGKTGMDIVKDMTGKNKCKVVKKILG